MGSIKHKSSFEHAECADSDHHVHAQSIIWAIALHLYIL